MDQIGRYRITGELGRGAMGIVYKAEDPAIGRTVAVKTIRLGDVGDAKERSFLRDRLFREARSAGILSHPNIVTIYDIQEHDDMAYVFMEYVDGPSLEKVMAQTPLDRAAFLRILDQTGAALDYAHSRGIVHRDIKPANIMLASDGSAKITDFGVAKIVSAQATQTGVVMGTPSYMSPEQIADKPLDGRSDQFSLAVIAYQLLTGEKPFSGPTLPSLMYKIVHELPLPPQRLNPSLGTAVEMVLKRGLDKEAAERFPSCAQFVKALGTACESRPGWVLMGQGGVESIETVAGSTPAQLPATPALPATPPESSSGSTSIPTRKGGWLGPGIAMALGLLLVGGLSWIGYRLLFNNDSAQPASETAAAPVLPSVDDSAKPSPMGPDKPKPPAPEPVSETTGPAPPAPGTQPPAPTEPKPVKAAPPQFKEVEVRFTTTPAGAKIAVDGVGTCTSPCEPVLPSGKHRVTATLDGYRSATRVVSVPEELEVLIQLERATGTVMVTSTPPGGSIVVDGQARKEKTPASISLPAGKHKVQVQVEGFSKDEQDVDVKEGSFLRIDFSWKTN